MIVINRDFISKVNTYAGRNQPKYIVIHETDNWNNGAGGQRHADAQQKGHLSMSVHYYAGSDGVYQAAEHADGTYSVGREYGGNHSVKDATNRNTINIEICVNADGDYAVARANAIELVKYLIQTTGIPAERVIRHYDAKGKYCPRRMMDDPQLWEDFKLKIGNAAEVENTQEAEKTENTANTDNTEKQEASSETWYRIGTGWKDGICQNQQGAYRNLDYAIIDCKSGFSVYDDKGTVVYVNGVATENPNTIKYTLNHFIKDVQAATGSEVDGYAGDETLDNTPTVSRIKNKNHAVVTALERRLCTLGYYTGTIEADFGKTPCFGSGMETAVNKYQKEVLGYKNPDGEITARKKMWKSLLGMI